MKEQHASTSRKPSSQEGFLLCQYTEQCLWVGHIPATERIWSVSCVEHALGPPLRAYAPPLLSCRILALSEDGFCHFEAGKCWWSFFLWLVTLNADDELLISCLVWSVTPAWDNSRVSRAHRVWANKSYANVDIFQRSHFRKANIPCKKMPQGLTLLKFSKTSRITLNPASLYELCHSQTIINITVKSPP